MLWFVILYLFEGSIRKYVFASTFLILIKYIPLVCSLRLAILKNLPFIAVFSSLLLLTLPSLSIISYALYETFAIVILPLLTFCIVKSNPDPRLCIKILFLLSLGGVMHSILIILQSRLGPQSIFSISVNQDFTAHTFEGGLFFKAPGLTAVPSPHVSFAALIAIYSLRKLIPQQWKFLLGAELAILLSVASNLSSRTYVYSVLAYYVLTYLIVPVIAFLRGRDWTIVLSFRSLWLFLLSILSIGLLSQYVDSILVGTRSFNFDEALARISTDFIPYWQIFDSSVPIFGGYGIGSSLSASASYVRGVESVSTLSYCLGVNTEYEFPRLICSFGLFGYLIIIYRYVLSLILLRYAFFVSNSSSSWSKSGIAFISLYYALGIQLRPNEALAGLLLVAIASSCSISLDRFQRNSPIISN